MTQNIVRPGIKFIERLMKDQCRIERDWQNIKDDILDEDTGELVKPAGDSIVTYSGKCILTHLTRKELEYTNAEQPLFRKMYRVNVPLSAYDVRIGDVFFLTESGPPESTMEHDQYLLDTPMRVQQVDGGTFAAYRTIRVEDIREDHGVTYR